MIVVTEKGDPRPNGAETDGPDSYVHTDSCIHTMVEAQAARTPEAEAIGSDAGSLTYDALNRRANRLARRLQALGVGPGSLVGVCLERSLEMVIGLLGVLKAGGAYVPMDPQYPAERLAFMLSDAQVGVLLTHTALAPRLPAHAGVMLCVDADGWGAGAPWGDEDITGGTGPDDLAYVIYTSGSTGLPKGVEIRHRGVCSNLHWRQAAFPLTAKDRLLQSYSFSFDPSVWAFFWPLSAGAGVVLARPGENGDPGRVLDAIQRQRISVLGFSPSMLRLLLEQPQIGKCDSLRHVFSGGEPLTPDLVGRFYSALPGARLHNVYGPTEATIDAAWWTCPPGEMPDTIPIGHALPGTRLYVLGEDGSHMTQGTGDLHIAGVGLARGYHRRPELTAARFTANPFCRDDTERALFPTLYKTGDLCRQRPDGTIEYVGRLDDQVKVRGFRIEIGEVEAALARHPGVCDVVVIAREDTPGDKRLVAYIVPGAASAHPRSLKQHAEDGLPAHMVPAAFVLLTGFPLSPNGKLDRAALPRPTASDWGRVESAIAPRTPLERQLVSVFEGLLGVSPLGVGDDFFEWGGHSLLAARLVGDVERLTGRRLAMTDLVAGATAERLAALCERPGDALTLPPLVQEWAQGTDRPFFFLHGSFTGGLYCAELARRLGPDRPFYGLMPHGADGGPIPPTVEAMAAEYVTMIRAIQPDGPYLVGGFCNGGLAAYEVARQLAAAGAKVERLVLVEVILAPTLAKLRLHEIAERLSLGMTKAPLLSALQMVSIPALLALRSAKRLWRLLAPLLGRDAGYDWTGGVPPSYQRSAVFYSLRPYRGRVTFIYAEESAGRFGFGHLRGWLHLAPQAAFETISGGHYGSTHEELPRLAELLKAHLIEHHEDASHLTS